MTAVRLNGLYQPDFVCERRQHFAVGSVATGMDPCGRNVKIHDARALQATEALSEAQFFSRHSFVLLPHVSRVHDWDEDGNVYPSEIDQIIRDRLFPGKRVEIQHGPHVLRRGRDTATPDYGDGVHSDGGLDLDDYLFNIGAFAGPEATKWWRSLYERPSVSGLVWIDFWRTTNMNGPLEHMPLALCDPHKHGPGRCGSGRNDGYCTTRTPVSPPVLALQCAAALVLLSADDDRGAARIQAC